MVSPGGVLVISSVSMVWVWVFANLFCAIGGWLAVHGWLRMTGECLFCCMLVHALWCFLWCGYMLGCSPSAIYAHTHRHVTLSVCACFIAFTMSVHALCYFLYITSACLSLATLPLIHVYVYVWVGACEAVLSYLVVNCCLWAIPGTPLKLRVLAKITSQEAAAFPTLGRKFAGLVGWGWRLNILVCIICVKEHAVCLSLSWKPYHLPAQYTISRNR